jgi:RNA polymerase sigma-B factor
MPQLVDLPQPVELPALVELPLAAEFARLRATGDAELRRLLIEQHSWIAEAAARRFSGRGEQYEDLAQVAHVGVVKAVDRYDPTVGAPFPSYAAATAVGEVRRHFRDRGWGVQVPRRLKELSSEIAQTIEILTHELGRSPKVPDIAARLSVSEENVLEALEAGGGYRPVSLAAPSSGDDTGGATWRGASQDDESLELLPDRLTVRALVAALPPRERRIVVMRFFESRSQAEIAKAVGVSQVHVSRLLRSSLETMRRVLDKQAQAERTTG